MVPDFFKKLWLIFYERYPFIETHAQYCPIGSHAFGEIYDIFDRDTFRDIFLQSFSL